MVYISKCHLQTLPINFSTYHIASGTLSREKTFAQLVKYDCRENFRGLLAFAVGKDATPPNFVEKTFAYSNKTAKFAKVFSLESFLLYSTWEQYYSVHFLKKIRT